MFVHYTIHKLPKTLLLRCQYISALLATKSDTVRKGEMNMDLKKVDVENLANRSTKPAKNSHRELGMTKHRRSARLSSRKKPRTSNRSRSANKFEAHYDEEVFATHSARI